MPDKAKFEDVCQNLHALFYRIAYIDKILKSAKDNQKKGDIPEYEKWLSKGRRLIKELKEDCEACENLTKRMVQTEDVTKDDWFRIIDHDGSKDITGKELEFAISSAVKRFKINSKKLLGGWTVTEFFRCMDADRSRGVSLEEWLPVEQLKSQFRRWDADGNGSLSSEELKKLMLALNPSWSKSELNQLWSLADKNNSGKVEYDEFVDFIMVYGGEEEHGVETDPAGMLKEQFRKWDKDNSGRISKEELGQLLRTLNPSWNAEQLDNLFKLVDKNGNNQIEYDEFASFIFNQDEIIKNAH